MRNNKKKSGMSLTEILVVIGIMAILMAVSVPAAKQLAASFETGTGARQLINAALSNARAIAVREQAYAGVRFQEDTSGNTYMTFIIHDPNQTGLANGFCAVTGRKPMKLPENVGVIDTSYFERVYNSAGYLLTATPKAINDLLLSDIPGNMTMVAGQRKNRQYVDATTFSVVFNPSGKLSSFLVWVNNVDGIDDTSAEEGNNSRDNIFNKKDVVDGLYRPLEAMFYQDDYGGSPTALYTANFGIGAELSRQSFLIFDKTQYKQVQQDGRVSKYLINLDTEFISPYTGELVMEYRE